MNLAPILCNNSSLKNVSFVSFLGVTLSKDLKWTRHFDNCIRKASKRIFIIRNLRRARCPSHLIFRAYASFIRSVLLYAAPCFCNAPNHLLDKFLRIERRIFRIIGSDSFPSLIDVFNNSCCKLFSAVHKYPRHTLRQMFSRRNCNVTRATCTLRPPFARTSRFKNSFIKFCK